jgi:phage host-nuclease inhibitor protein Gam
MVEIEKIADLNAADDTLRRIAEAKAEIAKLEGKVNLRLDEVKDRFRTDCEPLLAEIAKLEKSLSVYAEYNRCELFKDKKTLELIFGFIGYRQSTSISITKDTLGLLEKYGYTNAIAIKKTVDKEAMRDWDDERLELVAATRNVDDKFWLETKAIEAKDAA